MDAAIRVVRYTKGAPRQGLLMPVTIQGNLLAYYDTDWGASLHTRRSVSNYLVFYDYKLVFSWAKKSETIGRSLAKGEFRSMASTSLDSSVT